MSNNKSERYALPAHNAILNIDIIELFKGVVIGVLIFALIKPDSLEYIGLAFLETLLIVLDCLALALLIALVIAGKIQLKSTTISILLLMCLFGVSTALGSGNYFEFVKIAGPAMAACLLTDFMMQNKPLLYLKSASWTLAIMFSINLVTILMTYPNGLYNPPFIEGDCYFLGYDNGMIYNIIPMLTYSIVYSLLVNQKLLSGISLFAIAISTVSVIYVQAVTGIIALSIFLFAILIFCKFNINSRLQPSALIALFFAATLAIVVFHVQTYLSAEIYQLTGKDATLSGRTYLWDYAIQHIADNPLIGIGATTRSVVGFNGHMYSHPHCLVLDLLYKGGIPVFAAFLVTLFFFSRSYSRDSKNLISKVILIGVFALLVVEITGSVQFKPLFWALFALMSYSDKLNSLIGLDLCATDRDRGSREINFVP